MNLSLLFFALIALLSVTVIAIPSSELDYSDPYLMEKIINGSIVVDMPEQHKRQLTPMVRMYRDVDLQGPYVDYFALYAENNYTLSLPNYFSSLQLYSTDYVVIVYANTYCNPGSYRSFRTTKPIVNLGDQDSFNDQAKCIIIRYMGPIRNSVTMFEGNNFTGRATYLPLGNYPGITYSGSPPQARADQLSSIEIYPNTKVMLYENSDGTGQTAGYLYGSTEYANMASIPFCDNCASKINIAYINP